MMTFVQVTPPRSGGKGRGSWGVEGGRGGSTSPLLLQIPAAKGTLNGVGGEGREETRNGEGSGMDRGKRAGGIWVRLRVGDLEITAHDAFVKEVTTLAASAAAASAAPRKTRGARAGGGTRVKMCKKFSKIPRWLIVDAGPAFVFFFFFSHQKAGVLHTSRT